MKTERTDCLQGKIVATNPTASVCPVIGTGENGRGIEICANIAINAAKTEAIIISFSFI
jgi:hypothetical protein